MGLATYAELQDMVARWMARDDLVGDIPDFIVLFEAAANRRLRVRQQEYVAELTPTDGEVGLPCDYLSWRRLTWMGNPQRALQYVTPNWLFGKYTSEDGTPGVFTIEANTLTVRPISDTPLNLDYFSRIPALTAEENNWLFDAHPDVYLWGTLTEANAFAQAADKAAMCKARRDELFAEIELLSNKTRGIGPMLVVGPTP